LNTKNDDHEIELDALTNQHRSEIETVMQDAAAKVNKFKLLLDKRKDAAATEKAMQLLTEQYEREKAAALAQFDDFQKKCKEKETKNVKDFRSKTLEMKKTLDTVTANFTSKLTEFENLEKSLKSKLSKVSTEGNAALKSKQEELDQYIKDHNKKYSDMLAERLNEQDEMEKRLTREFGKEREELKTLYNREVKKLTSEAEEKLKSELARAEKEYTSALKLTKTELIEKIELLLADLEKLRGTETKVRSERDMMMMDLKELNAKFIALEADLENERKLRNKIESNSSASEAEKSRALADTTSKLQSMTDKFNSLTSENEKNKVKIVELEGSLAQLRSEMITNETEYKKNASKSKAEEELRTRELLKARQEIQTLDQRVREMTEALKSGSLAKDMETSQLQRKYQEDISALKASIETTEESFKKERTQLEAQLSEANTKVAALLTEISTMNAHIKTLNSTAAMEIKAVIANAKTETEKAVANARDTEVALRDKMMKDLHLEMEKVKSSSGETERLLRETINTLETERDQLLKELKSMQEGTLKSTSEANQKLQSRLSDVEVLLEKEKMITQGLRDELRNLEKEWQGKLRDAMKEAAAELKSAEAKHESNMVSLRNASEERLQAELLKLAEKMKADINKASSNASAQAQDYISMKEKEFKDQISYLQHKIDSLEESLQNGEQAAMDRLNEEKQRHQVELEKMGIIYEQTSKSMQEAREAEVKSLVDQLHGAKEESLANLEKQHAQALNDFEQQYRRELKALADEHRKAMEALNEEHNNALDRLRRDLMNQYQQDLAQHDSEARQDLQNALAKKESETRQYLNEQSRVHLDEVDRLNQDKDQLNTALRSKDTTILELSDEIQKAKSDAQAAWLELSETRKSMQNGFDNTIKLLAKQHERELEGLTSDHLAQTNALNEEYSNTMRLLEERNLVLKTQLEELEERYRSRESRPEDVSRIMELEQICRENEETIKQQAEEMKFFKLELINREENFNKMFSRSPTVGVMQVIKPNKPPLGLQENSFNKPMRKGSLPNPSMNQLPSAPMNMNPQANIMRRSSSGTVSTGLPQMPGGRR
jgi:hypothetical protein